MIQYEESSGEAPEPKKSFTIKKNKRTINILTDNPLMLITNSQPVTPSRPTICTEIKSERNTIDYFIEFTEKNREVLEKQLFLPSLSTETESSKALKPIKHSYIKKRSLQKESINQEDILSKDPKLIAWKRNRVGTSSGTQRVRADSNIREKAITIDVDKTAFKMKPLIIQNKFMAKFPQLKKPTSHQMRYFRSKIIKPSRTMENPEALFTFYPKQFECKTEVNEFLDIN